MKRWFSMVLFLLMVFSGCSKEIGDTVPNESKPVHSCISLEILTETRSFDGFAAGPCADAESARMLVQSVLEQYPAGFPDQWGSVELVLAGSLTGTGDFAGGHYAGFTQRLEHGWRIVLDTDRCDAGTVHHEIAHLLDGILTEAGALTEAEWMTLCPGGFSYGAGDFSDYPDFFADAYAMTDIREDRARTFEDAALFGPGVYGDRPALWLKLECFSRAIRTHFNTDGWPAKTFWELALE